MGTVAATPPSPLPGDRCPARYRPRNPRATALYQLLESCYETVKGLWEERFERRYGFWKGFYDTAVVRYFDCGLFESFRPDPVYGVSERVSRRVVLFGPDSTRPPCRL